MPASLRLIIVLFIIYLTMKKPTMTAEQTVPKAKPKAKKPVATQVAQAAPQKPSPKKAPPKKAPAAAVAPQAQPVVEAAPEITVSERMGLTAGNVWHYLSDNGDASVAQLIQALPEEEKIIQRSIGWLAQEGKITLKTVDRVETIALKH